MKAQPGDYRDRQMRKGITLILDEQELQELYRILLDEDSEAALAFLRKHTRHQVLEALEGG